MARTRGNERDDDAGWIGEALLDGTGPPRALDEGAEGRAAADRLALGQAALAIAGEGGYEAMTVAGLIDRAGSNRDRFYSAFADKEACFAWAYQAGTEALAGRLLGRCAREEGWAAGMRAALLELTAVLDAQPEVARGLIARPGGAGAAVAAKREEVVGRLSRAIDRARRETVESRHPVPPFTPEFILEAVQGSALKFLAEGGRRSFAEEVPGLLWLAVNIYFGRAAAEAQLRALEEE